jgi:serine/threonine protein kinase
LREIIILRHLSHPNIIKLRDVIVEGDSKMELYLVLDYFPLDIKKVVKSNLVLTYKNVKEIVFQILAGLNYCHQCQVLHRDLKPENILITEDLAEVKLCDFGLARAVVTEEQKEYEKKIEEKETAQNRAGLSAHVTTRWYRAP